MPILAVPLRAHRAVGAIYTAVVLVVLTGFCSFGVDYGRVQLAKSQLEIAADAAARATAHDLATSVSAAQSSAVAVAVANTCDGVAVTLDAANDIEFGTWDTSAKTFTVLTGSAQSTANAVRITARRLASRGTALPLYFGRLVGMGTCDARGSSIAMFTRGTPVGFTSLNNLDMGKKFWGASYNSTSAIAPTHANCLSHGIMQSNGVLAIYSHAQDWLYGSIILGPSGSKGGGLNITGTTTVLSSPIAAPPVSMQVVSSNPGGVSRTPSIGTSQTWPGGTYYLTSLATSGSGSIQFSGPATVYLDGDATLNSGALTAYQNVPANLTVYQATGHNFTLALGAGFTGVYNGPGANFIGQGTNTVAGAVLALSITVKDNCDFYYDEALGSTGLVVVSLVK